MRMPSFTQMSRLCCLVAFAFRATSASPFRQPAVPLAVSTPFASIWSFDAGALATQTYFWDGYPYSLNALMRVDGRAFVVMGAPILGAEAATQEGFPYVASTSSWYTFSAGGVRLQLRLSTPHLPENIEVAARPSTFVVFNVSSYDGASHSVQVYLDSTAEIVCAGPGQAIEWDRPLLPSGIAALRLGQVGQREGTFNYSARLRNSTEPHQRQDFGFVYLLADPAATPGVVMTSVITSAAAAQGAFAATGSLPGPSGDATPPSMLLASSNNTVAALAWDLGVLSASSAVSKAATGVFFVDVRGGAGPTDVFPRVVVSYAHDESSSPGGREHSCLRHPPRAVLASGLRRR